MRGSYDPNKIIEEDPDLKAVMHLLESGHFNLCEPGIFDPIVNTIRDSHDQWLTAADFRSFIDAQKEVGTVYQQKELWARKSILNTASSGMFSSDRTIGQYADEIWRLKR